MSDIVRASPVPGWYDDPAGSGQLRWWTGAGWTEHLAPKAQPAPLAREPEPFAIAAPAQIGSYFIARRIVLSRVGVKANAPGNVLAAYFLTLIALGIVGIVVIVTSGVRA